MRMNPLGRLAPHFLRLVVGASIGLIGANTGLAQDQPAPEKKAQAKSESAAPSQVFPDGEFPTAAKAVEAKPAAAEPGPQPANADKAPLGAAPQEAQDGPGADYSRYAPRLPDYYYEPSYYETTGIGARPIADYAPAGYEARETDEGQAPGVPEFTPITPPPRTTADERQKFVTGGMMPGSFLVPGTNTSFRLRGFVRATGLYDLDPIGSRDDFVTNTIPVPQTSGQNANFSARASRFALESWTPTSIFDWNLHTFIEADFFNGPAQAVGGGGNPFRLRFAFVDFGYFRIGQQNTVFMDGNAFPNTVDFAGPRGLVNQRRPSVRMTLPVTDQIFWAVGIEQPFSDITTNGLGTNVQNVPDFATHVRYETDFGHVQLSAIGRSIGYQPTGGGVTQEAGWGLSASTVFHPWALLIGSDPTQKANPSGLERSRILLQYTIGRGIGRYLQDIAGLGLDGEVNPTTGTFDTVYAAGWSMSYEHWYTEKWLTNVTFSGLQVGSNGGQPGTTYSEAKTVATSLWYIPMRNMSIGVEYIWGERGNLDTQTGNANRVNALFQYNF